jgi:short-subunit dehydrogenase
VTCNCWSPTPAPAGYAPLADVGAAETEQLWTLNATAPLLLIRAALPHLLARDEGGIITVASLLAFSAGQNAQYLPHRTIYASAKAATVALTRTLSTELADTKVRAMVVCPGRVQTDFADAAAQNDSQAMTAADVVTATWTAYNRGDTICVPALATSTEIDALTQAEAALLANGNKPTVADTYVVVRRVGADADGL